MAAMTRTKFGLDHQGNIPDKFRKNLTSGLAGDTIMTVLALTVKIRKSQDFLAPISGSPGDQIFHSLSEIQPQYS